MENLRNMFSLGGGGRATNITQGGRTNDTQGMTTWLRCSSFESEDQWDNTSVPFRDDPLAPKVSARFGAPGEQTAGDLAANDKVFALGGGGEVKPTTHHGRRYRHRHHQGESYSGPWPTRGARRHKTNLPIQAGPPPTTLRLTQGWQRPHERVA